MAGQLITGYLRNLRSSIRGARGAPDGQLAQLIAGANHDTGKADPNSPFYWLPDSEECARRTFMYHWKSGAQIAADMGTTDGTTSDVFFVNTNSATYTATSTQAGYEGQGVLTTGATSANHAGFIGTPGFLNVAGQVAVIYATMYCPDVNVNAYDNFFGFSNKTIAPGTSGTYPTDGAYWKMANSTGTGPYKAITSSNAANTDNDAQTTRTASATKFTQASGTAQSIELAVVLRGQTAADFHWRIPGTATNVWNKFTQSTTLPRNSVILRPHLVPCTRASAGIAFQIQELAYWWIRPTTY